MTINKQRRNNIGSALLAVYWTIAILSLAVFTSLQFLLQEVLYDNSRSSYFKAEQLAFSGAAIASSPRVLRNDPILNRNATGGNWSAQKSSEGGRFPINSYLSAETRSVVEDLLKYLGINENSASTLVDEMIDWVDSDSIETGNGKEIVFYASKGIEDLPFNRPFQSVEELSLLNSFAVLAKTVPDWQQLFTVNSSGKLDLNSAPAEFIAAVCECSLTTAENFVAQRSGRDQRMFTSDDQLFQTLDEALASLETNGAERLRLLPRFSLDDATKRIISVGTFQDISVEQVLVVRGSQLIDISTRQLK